MKRRHERLRCPSHERNLRFEWVESVSSGHPVASCGFVRRHFHLEGNCQKWNGLTGGSHPSDNGLRCECGRELVRFVVEGVRKDEVECNEKCRSARGPACECKCGGENHGV